VILIFNFHSYFSYLFIFFLLFPNFFCANHINVFLFDMNFSRRIIFLSLKWNEFSDKQFEYRFLWNHLYLKKIILKFVFKLFRVLLVLSNCEFFSQLINWIWMKFHKSKEKIW
jgi:hypothetical protein